MRVGLAFAMCGWMGLVGCGGGSSSDPMGLRLRRLHRERRRPLHRDRRNTGEFQRRSVERSAVAVPDLRLELRRQFHRNRRDSSHTYATAGVYPISLTVTDTSNLTGSSTSQATIAAAQLPGAALTGLVTTGLGPDVGAHVYLLAANTTGYGGVGIAASSGNASLSLLTRPRPARPMHWAPT